MKGLHVEYIEVHSPPGDVEDGLSAEEPEDWELADVPDTPNVQIEKAHLDKEEELKTQGSRVKSGSPPTKAQTNVFRSFFQHVQSFGDRQISKQKLFEGIFAIETAISKMFEDEDADDPHFERYKEQLGQEYEEFRDFRRYLELKNKFGGLVTDMSELGDDGDEEAFMPAVITLSDLKSQESESNIADEDEEGAFRIQLDELIDDDVDTYFDEL